MASSAGEKDSCTSSILRRKRLYAVGEIARQLGKAALRASAGAQRSAEQGASARQIMPIDSNGSVHPRFSVFALFSLAT